MTDLHRHRTLREHFTHPKGYRAILRNKRIGVFTFAWEETPEVPHNPEVVICFHPYGCANEWSVGTSRHTISFEQHNPSSMGVALGREVWNYLIDQDGWEFWNGEQETP